MCALQGVAGKSWPDLEKCDWGWGKSGQIGKIRAQIVFVKFLGVQALCKQTLHEVLQREEPITIWEVKKLVYGGDIRSRSLRERE